MVPIEGMDRLEVTTTRGEKSRIGWQTKSELENFFFFSCDRFAETILKEMKIKPGNGFFVLN